MEVMRGLRCRFTRFSHVIWEHGRVAGMGSCATVTLLLVGIYRECSPIINTISKIGQEPI